MTFRDYLVQVQWLIDSKIRESPTKKFPLNKKMIWKRKILFMLLIVPIQYDFLP